VSVDPLAPLGRERRIPGGCKDCNAYQTAVLSDGIYHLTVHHDPTCPYYLGMTRNR